MAVHSDHGSLGERVCYRANASILFFVEEALVHFSASFLRKPSCEPTFSGVFGRELSMRGNRRASSFFIAVPLVTNPAVKATPHPPNVINRQPRRRPWVCHQ